MRIDTPTDVLVPAHPITLVVGVPGVGKTSLGFTYTNPVLLNFDGGAHRAVNRLRGVTLTFDSWQDAQDNFTRRFVRDGNSDGPFTAVTIDTVQRLLTLLTAHLLERDPRCGKGGVLNQRGWGQLFLQFTAWIHEIRGWGVDLLLNTHAKESRVPGPDGRDLVKVKPDIQGSSLNEVMAIADFVGYFHHRGTERVIDFTPSATFNGKGPFTTLVVPPIERGTLFMQELVAAGREAIRAHGQTNADSARQVAAFVERLRAGRGAEHFTALLPIVAVLHANAPKMVYEQARAQLWDTARAAGLTFADGRFVVDAAAAVRPIAPRPAPVVGVPAAAQAMRAHRAASWQPQLLSALTTDGGAR